MAKEPPETHPHEPREIVEAPVLVIAPGATIPGVDVGAGSGKPIYPDTAKGVPSASATVSTSGTAGMVTTTSPATTVAEEELRTAGQRRINLIWEITQAIIAIAVTLGTLWIIGSLLLRDGSSDSRDTAFLLLSNAFFMIMTSYHTRTNHTKTGGISGRGER